MSQQERNFRWIGGVERGGRTASGTRTVAFRACGPGHLRHFSGRKLPCGHWVWRSFRTPGAAIQGPRSALGAGGGRGCV